jgi:hypothetical protein
VTGVVIVGRVTVVVVVLVLVLVVVVGVVDVGEVAETEVVLAGVVAVGSFPAVGGGVECAPLLLQLCNLRAAVTPEQRRDCPRCGRVRRQTTCGVRRCPIGEVRFAVAAEARTSQADPSARANTTTRAVLLVGRETQVLGDR